MKNKERKKTGWKNRVNESRTTEMKENRKKTGNLLGAQKRRGESKSNEVHSKAKTKSERQRGSGVAEEWTIWWRLPLYLQSNVAVAAGVFVRRSPVFPHFRPLSASSSPCAVC